MDLTKLLESINNIQSFTVVTQQLRDIRDKSVVKLDKNELRSTVDTLTKIRSLEIMYFSTYHDKGAALLAFELILQLPPLRTWPMYEKTLAKHLAYWLDTVILHLIDHDVQWWSFVKPVLNLINLQREKSIQINGEPGDQGILVHECAAFLLKIATHNATSVEQAHQILSILNLCLKMSDKTLRSDLAVNLQECFSKLSLLMATCGHFPLQSSAMECYCKFLVKRGDKLTRVKAAKTWLPHTLYKQDVINVFTARTFQETFSLDSRVLLNLHNASNDQVISVQYDDLKIGTTPGSPTYWLDLNGGTRCLTINFYESQWFTLTVTCDNVTTVTLSRVSSQLIVTINTKEHPVIFPSSAVCSATNLEIRLVQGSSILKIDKGLRIVFGDNYQAHPDTAAEITQMKSYQRSKRCGVMNGEMSGATGSFTPSSTSTTSLAQLPERLAALNPQRFDKRKMPVTQAPGFSPVIELSDDEIPDSFESAITHVITPRPYAEFSFRHSQSDESSTPRPKRVYVENTQSDHDSRTRNLSAFVRLTRDPKISAMANSNSSNLQAADSTNQCGLESERVSDKNAMVRINSDIVNLLLQEALETNNDTDSGVITGYQHDDDVIPATIETLDITKVKGSKNVKSPVVPQNSTAQDCNVNLEKVTKQKSPETNKSPLKECSVMVENMPLDVIDKLTNSGDEVLPKYISQAPKKATRKKSMRKIITKSSTSDESNTSAISNTPMMAYVNVRKRNVIAQRPAETINEDDDESHEAQAVDDFFTSHYNDLACDNISPTRARQINETSSDSSDDLGACLMSNQDINVNVEQFNLDVDVMECVTNLVDKVCELEKAAQDMAQELSARNVEKSVAAEAFEVEDPESIKNIDKTKKGRGIQNKCAEKPTKPALKIKFQSFKNDKDVKRVNASKNNKLVQEPTTETYSRGTTDTYDTDKSDTDTSDRDTFAENNTNNKHSLRRKKRKLYSPKDDHKIDDDIHSDDSDDQPLYLIRKNSENQKKDQTKRPAKSPPGATSYNDIANDRKKNGTRSRRLSKILCRRPESPTTKSLCRQPECPRTKRLCRQPKSPRTKKNDEEFDRLKITTPENPEKLTHVKSANDSSVYNYNETDDSDFEDYTNKKSESSANSTRPRRAPKNDKNEEKEAAKKDKNEGKGVSKKYTKGKNPRSTCKKTKTATKKLNEPKGPTKRDISGTSNIERRVLKDERMRNAPQEDLNTSLSNENPQQYKPNKDLVPKINPPVLEVEDNETVKPKTNNKKPTKKKDLIKPDAIEHAKTPQSEHGQSSTSTLKSGRKCSKTPKLDILNDDTEGSVSSLPGLVVETVETEPYPCRDAEDSIMSSNLMQKVTEIFQNQNADNGNDTTQNLLLDEDRGSPSSFNFEELGSDQGNKNNATNVINSDNKSGQESRKKLERFSDISEADENGTQLTSSTTNKKSLTLKKAIPQKPKLIVSLTRLTADEIRQHSPKHCEPDETICLDDDTILIPVIEANCGPKKRVHSASNKNIEAVREKDSPVKQIERESDVESMATVDLTDHDDSNETPPRSKESTEQFEPREHEDPDLKRYRETFCDILNMNYSSDENDTTPKTRLTTNKETPKKIATTDRNTVITPKKMQRVKIRSSNSEEDLHLDQAFNYLPSSKSSDSEASSNHTNTKQAVNVTTRPINVAVDECDSETSRVSSGKINQWLRPKKPTTKELNNNNRKYLVSPIVDLTDSDRESSIDEVRKPTRQKVASRNDSSISKPGVKRETSKMYGNKDIEMIPTTKSPPIPKNVIKKCNQKPPNFRTVQITSDIIVQPASSPVCSTVSSTSEIMSQRSFPQKIQIPPTRFIEVTITPIKMTNDKPMSPESREIIKGMLGKSPEPRPDKPRIPAKVPIIQVNVPPSKIILQRRVAPQTVTIPKSSIVSIEKPRNVIKIPVISKSIQTPVKQNQNSSIMAEGNVETPQTCINRPNIRNTPEMVTKIAKGNVETPRTIFKRPNIRNTPEMGTKTAKGSVGKPRTIFKMPNTRNTPEMATQIAKGSVEKPRTIFKVPNTRNTPVMATQIAKGSVEKPRTPVMGTNTAKGDIGTPDFYNKRTNTDITPETVTKQSNIPRNVKTSNITPTGEQRPTGIKPPMKRPVSPSGSEVNPKRRKDMTQPDNGNSQSSSLGSVDEWLQRCEYVGNQDVPNRACLESLCAVIEEHFAASVAGYNEWTLRECARVCAENQKFASEFFAQSLEKSRESELKIYHLLQELEQIIRAKAEEAKWAKEKMKELAARDQTLIKEYRCKGRAKLQTIQKQMKDSILALLLNRNISVTKI